MNQHSDIFTELEWLCSKYDLWEMLSCSRKHFSLGCANLSPGSRYNIQEHLLTNKTLSKWVAVHNGGPCGHLSRGKTIAIPLKVLHNKWHYKSNITAFHLWCWSRSGNQWIWVKNFKSVQTFRISSVTYMKRFEANKKVFSVHFCPPEAIFWRRGQMVGKKWAISENHHIFYFCL